MAKLVIPHIFTPGTPAQASQMNANFDAISNWSLSGQIETDSIKFPLESRSNDNQNNTRPILKFVQTIDEKILELQNAEGSSSIYISQTEELNASTGIIHINDQIAQTESASAAIKLVLSSVATSPAILVSHGTETLSLTKSAFNLFASAVEISAARIKVPVRNTADKIAVTQEGSVVYDSTKKELAFRTNTTWIPASTPTGCVQMFAGSAAPQGWLLCNGAEYLKGDYPELNTMLSADSYPYGQTNGSGGAGTTHFRVPDLRGRVAVGFGQGAGLTNRNTLNAPSGAETHLLTGAESGQKAVSTSQQEQLNQFRNFVFDLDSEEAGGNNYSWDNNASVRGKIIVGPGGENKGQLDLNHTHKLSAENATNAHNNMQPFIVLNYIIKY